MLSQIILVVDIDNAIIELSVCLSVCMSVSVSVCLSLSVSIRQAGRQLPHLMCYIY